MLDLCIHTNIFPWLAIVSWLVSQPLRVSCLLILLVLNHFYLFICMYVFNTDLWTKILWKSLNCFYDQGCGLRSLNFLRHQGRRSRYTDLSIIQHIRRLFFPLKIDSRFFHWFYGVHPLQHVYEKQSLKAHLHPRVIAVVCCYFESLYCLKGWSDWLNALKLFEEGAISCCTRQLLTAYLINIHRIYKK